MKSYHKYFVLTALSTLSLTSAICTEATSQTQRLRPAPKGTFTAPAQVKLQRSWSMDVDATFTYWEALQDNMELGVVSPPQSTLEIVNGDIINNSVEYKPGFKVELGFGTNYDGWDTHFEYTWFRSTQRTHKNLENDDPLTIFPLWLAPNGNTFDKASQKWHLQMDLLDWVLGRESLIGKKFTLRPFFGLRAAWIDQNMKQDYEQVLLEKLFFYRGKSRSWAIGPKIGMDSKWRLGAGFRMYGNLDADLLYTRYTRLRSREDLHNLFTGVISLQREIRQKELRVLRPHCNIELGLGWSSYVAERNGHIDLSIGYSFQAFWGQNMFRKFIDDTEPGSSFSPNGDLYLQGLTAAMKFAF